MEPAVWVIVAVSLLALALKGFFGWRERRRFAKLSLSDQLSAKFFR